MDHSASQYVYCPLPPGPYFRLLRLLPEDESEPDGPPRCELTTYRMYPSKDEYYDCEAQYCALSYVWGDARQMKPIVVDGKTLLVTENLYAGLLSLRAGRSLLPGSQDVFWIDAICINQEDVREREHQVQHMAVIYARALSVLVWLREDRIRKVRHFVLDKSSALSGDRKSKPFAASSTNVEGHNTSSYMDNVS